MHTDKSKLVYILVAFGSSLSFVSPPRGGPKVTPIIIPVATKLIDCPIPSGSLANLLCTCKKPDDIIQLEEIPEIALAKHHAPYDFVNANTTVESASTNKPNMRGSRLYESTWRATIGAERIWVMAFMANRTPVSNSDFSS